MAWSRFRGVAATLTVVVAALICVACTSDARAPVEAEQPVHAAPALESWAISVRVENTPAARDSRTESSYDAELVFWSELGDAVWSAELTLLTVDGTPIEAFDAVAAEPGRVRFELDDVGRVRALSFDTAGNLEATVPLLLLVQEWALVRGLDTLDGDAVHAGYGGRSLVRVRGDQWSRAEYVQTPHLQTPTVDVLVSDGTRTRNANGLAAFRTTESLRAADGEQVSWELSWVRQDAVAADASSLIGTWRPVAIDAPVPDLIAYGQDAAMASSVSGPALLEALGDALTSGMMPTPHEWLPPAAARLRLEPELPEIVVRQTLARMDEAIAPGLAKTVDALIAAGSPEAQAALRTLVDDPAFRAHPAAASVTQHLALHEAPTVETLEWAVARALADPVWEQRLASVTIAASGAQAFRDAGDVTRADEAGQQLGAAYDALATASERTPWLLAMGNNGYAGHVPRVEAAFTSADVELRAAATRALRRVSDDAAEALLLRALDDDSDRVLDRALQSLSARGLDDATRDAIVLRLTAERPRAPVVPWLLREFAQRPYSDALCVAARTVAQSAVLERHQAGWELITAACEAPP